MKAVINPKTKVAVAISGGVDSSVAAYLLKEQGYDVVGVHMICYSEDVPYCSSQEDREFAVRVAAHLGIPLKIYDFRKEYKERVIDYMVEEYRAGRTPNPDVMCNRDIKFGILFDKVFDDLGVDFVATGHYSRILCQDSEVTNVKLQMPNSPIPSFNSPPSQGGDIGGVVEPECWLRIPADRDKDQTYFLYTLSSEQLSRTLFPLGDLKKSEVKKIAEEAGLPSAGKKESMGICFVGDVSIHEFLKDHIPYDEGDVLNEEGEIIGRHIGLPYYTVGQRSGFTVTQYVGEPLYVMGKNSAKNQLVVGPREKLRVKEFVVSGKIREIEEDKGRAERDNSHAKRGGDLYVRIRHLGKLHRCTVEAGDWNLEAGREAGGSKLETPTSNFQFRVSVHPDEPLEAVAPGQAAVFYDGDGIVVGGGVISENYK